MSTLSVTTIETGSETTDLTIRTANTSSASITVYSTSNTVNIDGDLTIGSNTVSSFGKSLIDDADAAAARTTLGLSSASQAEMEAGTEAALRSMSPLLVAQAIAALGGGGGITMSIQTFTSSGTYTKPSGLLYALVFCTGGGGGGVSEGSGDTGSGGGAGGTAIKLIAAASVGSTETVTVGNGGNYSTGGTASSGGASSFGAHCTGSGGSGGVGNSLGDPTEGGAGGSASNGDININGGYGGSSAASGVGGSSFWGGTNSYGSGGGGSSFAQGNYGVRTGTAGVIYVLEFKSA
jgi:hypothetical protein